MVRVICVSDLLQAVELIALCYMGLWALAPLHGLVGATDTLKLYEDVLRLVGWKLRASWPFASCSSWDCLLSWLKSDVECVMAWTTCPTLAVRRLATVGPFLRCVTRGLHCRICPP